MFAPAIRIPPGKRRTTAEQVEEIAKRLVAWRDAENAADKLVWLLEHEYSEAGLSFDALKNADAALAKVLARAAERADCALYAAIVHIEEHGDATYEGEYLHGWDTDGIDAERHGVRRAP